MITQCFKIYFSFWPLSPSGSYSGIVTHRNQAPAPCQRRWGMSQCHRGATGPTSGGVEADEISVCRATYLIHRFCCGRNFRVSFDNEFLHGNYKLLPSFDKRITPYFKSMSACHECLRLEISARSSEREQGILAASRSVRCTLLHRERETSFEF